MGTKAANINPSVKQQIARNIGRCSRLKLAMAKPTCRPERKESLLSEYNERMEFLESVKNDIEELMKPTEEAE